MVRSRRFATFEWSIPFHSAGLPRPRRLRAVAAAGSVLLFAVALGSAAAVAVLRGGQPGGTCRAVTPDPAQPVAWTGPADPRARDENARWCDTVGPVIFRPAPAAVHPLVADRLTVVTWNVDVGGGSVDELIVRLRRGDFTGDRGVTDFVLLLQEEFRAGEDVPAVLPPRFQPPSRIAPRATGHGREDIRTVASEHGLALLYVPSMRNGGVVRPLEDRGNAILSTVALRDAAAIELPIERQRRVAVVAAIDGETSAGAPWTLRLADVHLDTAVALTRGGPFAARRRQAEGLVAALAATTAPTIVAGDFNTWRGRGEPALGVLRNAFPLSDQVSGTPGPGATWRGVLGLRAPLDHVFARGVGSITVRRLPARLGSDHYPLIAEVALR